MRLKASLTALVGLSHVAAAAADAALPPSVHMVDSIMSRNQGVTSSGAATSTLESGLLAIALAGAVAQHPESARRAGYTDYLAQVVAIAAADLTNATRDAGKPLDRFSVFTGIADAEVYAQSPPGGDVGTAHEAINASFALQTRNPDGGLWYYVYPEWSYLDGLFSLLPFMAAAQRPNYTDMALQVSLLVEHCYDDESGLYFHGYDWSRKAVWANRETGASPFVWGRSLAWFLAGLVQTWEAMGCQTVGKRGDGDERTALCAEIKRIMGGASQRLITYADAATGAWWQLPTLGSREGNFLESSSTVLFIFALLKAQRTGLLSPPEEKCCGCYGGAIQTAALRAYDYTKSHFVTDTGNGTIGFDKTVSVCSLNSTATFEYYTQRPLVPNGVLGEAAFILASLEVERLDA